jgi:hypothetical protein
MSEQNKIDEIKEALAAATPGPWEYEIYQGMADVYPVKGKHVPVCQMWAKSEEPMENSENNADLIAKAPEYITYLLQEIERKDAALRFYADEVNYEEGQSFQDPECGDWFEDPPKVISDDGQRAREAL